MNKIVIALCLMAMNNSFAGTPYVHCMAAHGGPHEQFDKGSIDKKTLDHYASSCSECEQRAEHKWGNSVLWAQVLPELDLCVDYWARDNKERLSPLSAHEVYELLGGHPDHINDAIFEMYLAHAVTHDQIDHVQGLLKGSSLRGSILENVAYDLAALYASDATRWACKKVGCEHLSPARFLDLLYSLDPKKQRYIEIKKLIDDERAEQHRQRSEHAW